jgi:hypothetical protein
MAGRARYSIGINLEPNGPARCAAVLADTPVTGKLTDDEQSAAMLPVGINARPGAAFILHFDPETVGVA